MTGRVAALLVLFAASAEAQDLPPGHPPMGAADLPEGHPPMGAADLPEGHPPMEAQPPAEGQPLPEGHPPIGGAAEEGSPEDGEGSPPSDPHAGMGGMGGMGGLRLPADDSKDAVEEDQTLAPGTIVVEVVNPDGSPIAGQRVELAILKSDQSRDRLEKTTGTDGRARFDGLRRGSDQAYRVYAPYRSAKYGSEPFQLGDRVGTHATLTRWPVTSDVRKLLLFMGNLVVEFREEGMQLTGHMRFMNFGGETVVPEGGSLEIPLPQGARAFAAEPVMTDQRLSSDDESVLVRGSFPPGETTLAYRFQVPLDGTEATIEYGVPFRVVMYQVLVEKTPGSEIEIEGMPDPEDQELGDGRMFVGTRLQRRPGDPPFDRVRIAITGLPGEGPGRWIAIAVVTLFLFVGVRAFARGGEQEKLQVDAREAERERLLALAVALEQQQRGDGARPEAAYHSRRERIVDRLAALYRADD